MFIDRSGEQLYESTILLKLCRTPSVKKQAIVPHWLVKGGRLVSLGAKRRDQRSIHFHAT